MNTEAVNKKKGERAALVRNMRSLLDKASAEKRELNTEESSSYDNMEKEVSTLGREIDREENLSTVENKLKAVRDNNYRPGLVPEDAQNAASKHPTGTPEYKDAFFNSYARAGKSGLSHEVLNAMSVGTSADAGYLVPVEFETKLLEYLIAEDPIRANATIFQTRSDRNIPIETGKGTFSYIGENGLYPQNDPSVGRVIIGSWKSGGVIPVSEELLQDSFFDLPPYLLRLAGERYMKLEEQQYVVGTGAGAPLGIFQNATLGVGGVNPVIYTSPSATGTPAVSGDDLIETFHALTRPYRAKASWLMGDPMVKLIRKLKDLYGQYLWQPGLQAGKPDMLLGRPVLISDYAPAPALSTVAIAFGDLSYYYIGDRLGTTMQRLNELYAANGQVGFRFTKRDDGKLVDGHAFSFYKLGT